MIPYDGTGYGASIYWRTQMKEIAEKNNESCPCWQYQEPKIEFKDEHGLHLKVSCESNRCEQQNDFSNTERELVNKFMRFYKG